MTDLECEAVKKASRRADQIGATMVMLSDHSEHSALMTDAVRGAGEMMIDLGRMLDEIIHPVGCAACLS